MRSLKNTIISQILLVFTSYCFISEEQCVEAALRNNFDIKVIRIGHKSKILSRKDALYNYLPKLLVTAVDTFVAESIPDSLSGDGISVKTSLTQSHPYGGLLTLSSGNLVDYDKEDITLSFSQQLLKGVIFDRSLISSKNDLKASSIKYKSDIINAVSMVRALYWETILKKQTLLLYKEALGLAKDLKDIEAQKFKLGMIQEINFLQAESDLMVKEGSLIQQENRFLTSFENLKFNTGVNGRDSDIPDTISLGNFTKPDSAKIINRLRRNNVSIKIARIDLETFKAVKGQTFDDRLPALALHGSRGFGSQKDLFLGLSLLYTFGDFSASYADRLKKLSLQTKGLGIEDLMGTVELTAKEKMRNIEFLIKSFDISRKGYVVAEKTLIVAKNGFELGTVSSKDLIDITNKYIRAKLNVMENLVACKLEEIELYRICGDYDIELMREE